MCNSKSVFSPCHSTVIPLFLFLSSTPPFSSPHPSPHIYIYIGRRIHRVKMYRGSAYMNNIANANTQDISNICEDRDPEPPSTHTHVYTRTHAYTPTLITEICNFVNKSRPPTCRPRHLPIHGFELIGLDTRPFLLLSERSPRLNKMREEDIFSSTFLFFLFFLRKK